MLFSGISMSFLLEIMITFLNAANAKLREYKKLSKIDAVPKGAVKDETLLKSRGKVFSRFLRYLVEFAELSSIPSFKHMVDKKPMKRFIWALFTLISSAFCMILIFDASKYTEMSSIELRIDEKVWALNDVSYQVFLWNFNEKLGVIFRFLSLQ